MSELRDVKERLRDSDNDKIFEEWQEDTLRQLPHTQIET
jgi:hypothetical protein